MKKILAMILAAAMVFALCACGQSSAPAATEAPAADAAATEAPAAEEKSADDLVYAVEAGSAGEAVALENGWNVVSVDTQSKALMEVAAGTSDAAIIDLLMAGAMIGEGTSYPDMKLGDELTTEEYGVGCRKGSDLADFINSVFAETYADGTMLEIAKTYGVQESLVEQPAVEEVSYADDGDVAYIKDKGTLIVGITDFEPMDYKDENGEWIGFDADMAKLVAEKLGVEIQFIEIDWDNKILELNNKSIDCVWNGMTLTDEVTKSMDCTNAYCNNAQVVVLPSDKADKYKDEDSLKDLQFAVEAGSAGEAAAEEKGFSYTSVTSQADTLMEVKAGTSDAAIIDLLMAGAMIGKGTSYPDLTHTLELTTEKYGVGCRQGSDLRDYINGEFVKLYKDGTMKKIAEKYGVQDALIEQK